MKSLVISKSFIEQRSTKLLLITSLVLTTALAAQITIPVAPVPFTLQTLFVLLAGGLLDKRSAFISMGSYLLAGIVGLPVFAAWSAGLPVLFGPTGGYLLAFPVAAFAVAFIIEKSTTFIPVLFAMFLGALIIFTFGTVQLYFVVFKNWQQALYSGFFIFSVWDALKIIAAASITYQYKKGLH